MNFFQAEQIALAVLGRYELRDGDNCPAETNELADLIRENFIEPSPAAPDDYTQADYDRNAIKVPADVKVTVPSIDPDDGKQAGPETLPCDVFLPPRTVIHQGCKISVLLTALSARTMPTSIATDPEMRSAFIKWCKEQDDQTHAETQGAPDDGKGQPVAWMIDARDIPHANLRWATAQKAEAAIWEAKLNCTVSPLYTHPAPQGWQQSPTWLDAAAREITSMFASLDGFPAIGASAGQDLEIKVEDILKRHAGGNTGETK